MSGQAKQMIDVIIAQRSGGNQTLMMTTRTKIMLKGVNPEKCLASTPDDPVIISKLRQIGRELGVNI
ncbi:MAG: hypothetical protein WCP04_00150 [Pseudomonadota bacterium]|jgi:hypothetical protein